MDTAEKARAHVYALDVKGLTRAEIAARAGIAGRTLRKLMAGGSVMAGIVDAVLAVRK